MNRDGINIKGLSKWKVLKALYDRAKTQGMRVLQGVTVGDMSEQEARDEISRREATGSLYFDYVQGRVLRCDIIGDTLQPWLYGRDNGNGAAEAALLPLIEEKGFDAAEI